MNRPMTGFRTIWAKRNPRCCGGRRRGTAAVEYALVTALIIIVCIGNLRMLGANSASAFKAVSRALESGESGAYGPPVNGLAAPQPSTAEDAPSR